MPVLAPTTRSGLGPSAPASPRRSLPMHVEPGRALLDDRRGVDAGGGLGRGGQVEPGGQVAPQVERAGPQSVRLSVTDRCDYACTYCRPSRDDGYVERRLDVAAWETLVDGLVRSGIRRFRLTGGEPLVHPKIVDLVRLIAARGVTDLALTTNASQLARLAGPLRDAGLMRLNVSIDTLDPVRFAAITRGGKLSDVLAGLDAARKVGFAPIKLNTVVLRGVNDDELEPIVRFAWRHGFVPRFLEIMPIAEGAKLAREHLVPVGEMRERLAHLLDPGSGPEVEPDRGPARYVAARPEALEAHGEHGELSEPWQGGDGTIARVGFISGTSDTFCESCDRLRVSATGMLRPCLATDVGLDASDLARAGNAEAMPQRVAEAWRAKPDGTTFRGCTEPSAADLSMRAIGG